MRLLLSITKFLFGTVARTIPTTCSACASAATTTKHDTRIADYMTHGQATEMLQELLRDMITEHGGETRVSNSELTAAMAKRYCRDHLQAFCGLFAPTACVCGQEVCPSRLSVAIDQCIRIGAHVHAPSSATVH